MFNVEYKFIDNETIRKYLSCLEMILSGNPVGHHTLPVPNKGGFGCTAVMTE
jgi:hypothetical protein